MWESSRPRSSFLWFPPWLKGELRVRGSSPSAWKTQHHAARRILQFGPAGLVGFGQGRSVARACMGARFKFCAIVENSFNRILWSIVVSIPLFHYSTSPVLYTFTVLHFYTFKLLYFCTFTHSFSLFNFSQFYAFTLFHFCTSSLLNFYTFTFFSPLRFSTFTLLHFYTFTLLHFYTFTLLHFYTFTLLHFCTVTHWHSCAWTFAVPFRTFNTFALLHFWTFALLHLCTFAFVLCHTLSEKTPPPGIEPGSSAWQADLLTTVLQRILMKEFSTIAEDLKRTPHTRTCPRTSRRPQDHTPSTPKSW